MATKNDLSKLLGGEEDPKKPVIRRGKGLQLSTEQQPEPTAEEQPEEKAETKPQDPETASQTAEVPSPATIEIAPLKTTQKRTNAKTQNRTSAKTQKRAKTAKKSIADLPVKHKRVNRGYKLREDLIKACKRVALEEDRRLYEVMEEALSFYLAHKFQEKS